MLFSYCSKIQVLISEGADPKLLDNDKMNPAAIALSKNHPDVFQYLAAATMTSLSTKVTRFHVALNIVELGKVFSSMGCFRSIIYTLCDACAVFSAAFSVASNLSGYPSNRLKALKKQMPTVLKRYPLRVIFYSDITGTKNPVFVCWFYSGWCVSAFVYFTRLISGTRF